MPTDSQKGKQVSQLKQNQEERTTKTNSHKKKFMCIQRQD